MRRVSKRNNKHIILFSRLLRWTLGGLFIFEGIAEFKNGGWPAIIFGAVILITGFFRPRRCLNEDQKSRSGVPE